MPTREILQANVKKWRCSNCGNYLDITSIVPHEWKSRVDKMYGVIQRTHVAQKEHKCAYGTNCTIRIGDIYIEETLAPWLNVLDDVDDDGHAIGGPLGRWEHWRYHQKCRDELEGRYYLDN